MINYRPMEPEDIPAGLSLCRAIGWNQLSRDWELFLKFSPHDCRVATNELGKVVGTVTTMRYQNNFSWIGMVLVDPAMQRLGIGMQLMHSALQILKDDETIKLDATPAGREVYLKMNFVDEYRISRMRMDDTKYDKLTATSARPINAVDIPNIIKFDRQVFGADRAPVLEWMLTGAPQYCFVVKEKDRICGYCFGRHGHNYNQIGPVIAEDTETAQQLLSAALRHRSDKTTIIDILHHTPEWTNWISSLGFAEVRLLTRMYRGENSSPGTPGKQFAILGPEFG